MKKIDSELHKRLETLIESMGYELVGSGFILQGRHMILRIYIDSERGVTIEDCSKVSRQVSAMMDVDDTIQESYSLEVSSPGIDRPLFEIKHYQQHVGKRIKIRLHLPINGRRQFKGMLLRVENENITFLPADSEQEVTVSFSVIDEANLIGDIF